MDNQIRSFEDLDVWQKCRELRNVAAVVARSLPGEERSRLTGQILSAARSITANIAEGYGRSPD
jgi:four helix bundle protein